MTQYKNRPNTQLDYNNHTKKFAAFSNESGHNLQADCQRPTGTLVALLNSEVNAALVSCGSGGALNYPGELVVRRA